MGTKIVAWIIIGSSLGIFYLCVKGFTYFDNKRKTIISTKNVSVLLLELEMKEEFTCLDELFECNCIQNYEEYDTIFIAQMKNSSIDASDIQIVKPSYINASISNMKVGGFNGLSMPRVNFKFNIESSSEDSVTIGKQFFFLRGNVQLSKGYWEASLIGPYKELERFVVQNDSLNMIAAKRRINTFSEKANEFSGLLKAEGGTSFDITSSSNTKSTLYKAVSEIFKILAIIVGILTLLFTSMYLTSLKTGDIET